MFNKLKEECGIFGIYAKNPEENLAYNTCLGLSSLQHRGEESCGIAINNGGIINCYKDVGLVSDVFKRHIIDKMPTGKMSMGHVRYSTTGEPKKENAQPIVMRYAKGNIGIVHNGNLINSYELREELQNNAAIFQTTSDTEIICYIIARERLKTNSIEEAIINTTKYIKQMAKIIFPLNWIEKMLKFIYFFQLISTYFKLFFKDFIFFHIFIVFIFFVNF